MDQPQPALKPSGSQGPLWASPPAGISLLSWQKLNLKSRGPGTREDVSFHPRLGGLARKAQPGPGYHSSPDVTTLRAVPCLLSLFQDH